MYYNRTSPSKRHFKLLTLVVFAAVLLGLITQQMSDDYDYESEDIDFEQDVENLQFWNPVTHFVDNIQSMKWLVSKLIFWSDSADLSHKKYDEKLTPEKRAHKYGFHFKQHHVTTKDAYQLTVFQIYHPKLHKNAPAVFLQHGLSVDANYWILNGKKSPAFILAAQGFNVFLGNNRGNRYSRKNQKVNPKKNPKKYFDYSFYELGKYDAPAQIDFVREYTGKDKIGYIGHSQGTTQLFSALAENHGNLNDKISSFIALAPVASFKYQKSRNTQDKLEGLHNVIKKVTEVTSFFGIYEIGPTLHSVKAAKTLLWPFLPKHVYNDLTTKSVCIKQILHFGQMELSGAFAQFDYGTKRNLQKYHQPMPPLINLGKIKVPISMYIGSDDMLASPKDNKYVKSQLTGTKVEHYEILKGFDHLQFSLDKSMNYFSTIVKNLKKHTK